MRKIPADILGKIESKRQVISENTQPSMKVSVARAKISVLDSSYWTVEEIRTKPNLGAISIAPRRLSAVKKSPDKLFSIHIENNIGIVTSKNYPGGIYEGWKVEFEVGTASDVAIAFDGFWKEIHNKWRFETFENPWIFWVTNTGKLMGQLWNDISTLIELAAGVSKVSSIRGWKNFTTGAGDQGIVVAYIKIDGALCYRNYAMQDNKTILWETERTLSSSGAAKNISLALTLDYRLIIIIENTIGEIYWLVTYRNWAGMAIVPDNIVTGITDIVVDVTPLVYLDAYGNENLPAAISDISMNVAEPIYPVLVSVENLDLIETQIILKFNYPIDYDLAAVKTAFEIKDSLNTVFAITSTNAGSDNSELILNIVNFAGYSGSLFIVYDRSVIEMNCLNQGSKFIIEAFNYEFIPEIAPPAGYVSENITFEIADIDLKVFGISYINSYDNENIDVYIDISIVVTKVVDIPL